MTPQILFYIIIAIIVISFAIDQYFDWLNAKHFDDPIPCELQAEDLDSVYRGIC